MSEREVRERRRKEANGKRRARVLVALMFFTRSLRQVALLEPIFGSLLGVGESSLPGPSGPLGTRLAPSSRYVLQCNDLMDLITLERYRYLHTFPISPFNDRSLEWPFQWYLLAVSICVTAHSPSIALGFAKENYEIWQHQHHH